MAHSLLAHLYSHIKGSQEDIATLSLQYLLSQSAALNEAFTGHVASTLEINLGEKLKYSCQSVGENNERPDMSGTNNEGKEVLLCEMKFYAALTPNQPTGYLERLQSNDGNGLIFICPKSRKTVLWAKLKERCDGRKKETINQNCICVDGIRMGIVSWAEIIAQLNKVAAISAEEYQADIKQLEGYCAQMDTDAFIPFSSRELTSDNAKKNLRYYQVVDETYNLLLADERFETEAVGKSSTYFLYGDRVGYEKKLRIGDYIVAVTFDHALWKNASTVDTPFWVAISDKSRNQTELIQKRMHLVDEVHRDDSTWSTHYLALEAPVDATLDEVCQDLKKQVIGYLDLFISG